MGIFGTVFRTLKDILFTVKDIISGLIQNAIDMGPFFKQWGKWIQYSIYILLICIALRLYFSFMYKLKGGEQGEVTRAMEQINVSK